MAEEGGGGRRRAGGGGLWEGWGGGGVTRSHPAALVLLWSHCRCSELTLIPVTHRPQLVDKACKASRVAAQTSQGGHRTMVGRQDPSRGRTNSGLVQRISMCSDNSVLSRAMCGPTLGLHRMIGTLI